MDAKPARTGQGLQPPPPRPAARRRFPSGRAAWCALAAFAALLSGPEPASAQDAPAGKRVVSLLELRQRNVVIQQWDLSCGAAALATLLQFQHGLPVTERDIASAMLSGTDQRLVRVRMGFSLLDMKRFADAVGLEGGGYGEVTLDDLKGMAPAIVPIRISEVFSHFVVFRGLVGDRVVLADPAFGNRTLPVHRFEAVWENKVAFVISRKDGAAAPNRLGVGADDHRVPAGGLIRNLAN